MGQHVAHFEDFCARARFEITPRDGNLHAAFRRPGYVVAVVEATERLAFELERAFGQERDDQRRERHADGLPEQLAGAEAPCEPAGLGGQPGV